MAPHLLVIDPSSDTIVDKVELQGHSEAGYKLRVQPGWAHAARVQWHRREWIPTSTSWMSATSTGNSRSCGPARARWASRLRQTVNTVLVLNDGDGTVTVIDLKAKTVRNSFKAGTGIETASYY